MTAAPTPEEAGQLSAAHSFLQLTPFGTNVVDITFGTLGVPPWYCNTLLGDRMWFAFWEGKSCGGKDIKEETWIPRQMLVLLQEAVRRLSAQATALATKLPTPEYARQPQKEAEQAAPRTRSRSPMGRTALRT